MDLDFRSAKSLFGVSRYSDQTFAQQIGSAKVNSKIEVNQCTLFLSENED